MKNIYFLEALCRPGFCFRHVFICNPCDFLLHPLSFPLHIEILVHSQLCSCRKCSTSCNFPTVEQVEGVEAFCPGIFVDKAQSLSLPLLLLWSAARRLDDSSTYPVSVKFLLQKMLTILHVLLPGYHLIWLFHEL